MDSLSQNRRYKIGLIKTLVIRIYRICSSKEIINKELSLLRKTLTNNGYPPHIIRRGIAEAQTLIRMRSDNKKNESSNNKVIFFTIKYYEGERHPECQSHPHPHLTLTLTLTLTLKLFSIAKTK